MVSLRCKLTVKNELEKLGLAYTLIELGEVELAAPLSETDRQHLQAALYQTGLELMLDKKAILIERIKNIIIEMIHYSDEMPPIKFSEYLSEKLNFDYSYISNLFSQTKGTTIAQFIILHKIEKVKELLLYDELSLSQIADRLSYSSTAHLSNQFKKVTGITPSAFKSKKTGGRITLEDI